MVKIMVVEDTATFRGILRHQLITIGITNIWMAADGEEALTMLHDQPDIDAIICDWHMHPMDGLTFCSKIRDVLTLQGRVIPVIFMTSDPKFADPEKRARLIEPVRNIGITEILPKPFNTNDLQETLSRCIGYRAP